MPLATTFTSKTVDWQGITWQFENPVTWGYYINGDPFVICPTGSTLNLTLVSPGVKFIPLDQMTIKPGPGQTSIPLAAITGGIGSVSPVIGSCGNKFGLVQRSDGVTGLFLNGMQKNPVRASPFSLYQSTTPPGYNLFSWSASSGAGLLQFTPSTGITSTFDTRYKDTLVLQEPLGINELEAMVNLSNGLTLIAGDVLFTTESTPWNDGQIWNRFGMFTASDTVDYGGANLSNQWKTSPRFTKLAILTVVSQVPDSEEFRPPYVWKLGDEKNRPTGFTFGSVGQKGNTFIDIPTVSFTGLTHNPTVASSYLPYNPSLGNSGGETGIPFPFDEASLNAILPSPHPMYLFGRLNQSTYPFDGANLACWNFFGKTLNEMISFVEVANPLDIGTLNKKISKAFGVASDFSNPSTSRFFGTRYELLMLYNTIAAFGSWINETTRKKCLVRTIQYGIDLYGSAAANQSLRLYQTENSGTNETVGKDYVADFSNRAYIILAGWLLGNQAMMNIDSINENEGSTLFAHINNDRINGGNTLLEIDYGNLTLLNSSLRFDDVARVRKLGGTYGVASGPRAFHYTDPGTTANIGIGWQLKNNIGQDGQYGIIPATAGLTNNISIRYLLNSGPSIPISQNTSRQFATIGLTMYAGVPTTTSPAGFPLGATGGNYAFPKMNHSGTEYSNSLITSSGGRPAAVTLGQQSLLHSNLKVVSGAGASADSYKIIAVTGSTLPPSSLSVLTWSGSQVLTLILDKPWYNGTPDSTSRIIIYPFDSTDIDKYVIAHAMGVGPFTATGTTSFKKYFSFPLPQRVYWSGTPSAGVQSAQSALQMYNFYLYGLIYALAKKSYGTELINNTITRMIIDSYIDSIFSSQCSTFNTYDEFVLSRTNDEYYPSNSFQQPMNIKSLSTKSRFLGGIMRNLWEREIATGR